MKTEFQEKLIELTQKYGKAFPRSLVFGERKVGVATGKLGYLHTLRFTPLDRAYGPDEKYPVPPAPSEGDVLLRFKNTESIDIVIEALTHLKARMIEERGLSIWEETVEILEQQEDEREPE